MSHDGSESTGITKLLQVSSKKALRAALHSTAWPPNHLLTSSPGQVTYVSLSGGRLPGRILSLDFQIGDSRIDKTVRYDTPDQVIAYLDAFYKRGYKQIDTARNYSTGAAGTSEPRLGAVEAGKRFIIDTKVKSREPGSHTREKIAEDVDTSLEELRIDQINIEYLHQPDRATPFEETCEAIDKAYREGKFKKFGLSNFTAGEVAQVLDICERRGFVKPSVYQGQYNPLVRGGEKELFPLLRKNNMAFYAWRYVVAYHLRMFERAPTARKSQRRARRPRNTDTRN